MFAESELNLFFLAAAIVMVYALIVRGSLKLGIPLKKEVVERGEALLGKSLSDEHRALVQHTLETLNSAWAAWASALFVLPASLTIAVQIILGARDTLEEDCGPYYNELETFNGLSVAAVLLNSPIAALLFVTQLTIVLALSITPTALLSTIFRFLQRGDRFLHLYHRT